MALLLHAVDSGVLRVLDLELVAKDADGTVHRVAPDELAPGGADLQEWRGAYSGLLDESDLTEIGAAIAPGSLARFQ